MKLEQYSPVKFLKTLERFSSSTATVFYTDEAIARELLQEECERDCARTVSSKLSQYIRDDLVQVVDISETDPYDFESTTRNAYRINRQKIRAVNALLKKEGIARDARNRHPEVFYSSKKLSPINLRWVGNES